MDKNAAIAIAIIGLGLLAFFIFTRRKLLPLETQPQEETIALRPKGSLARQYDNKETWSISYNPDGLPTKIEISRHAVEE